MSNFISTRQFLVLVIICCFCGILSAQHMVSGEVTEELNGEPLIGVSILIKDSEGIGTTTDIDGSFHLRVPDKNAVLVFSFLGYQDEELFVGEETNIQVIMSEDVERLEEVVVTALGIKRQKRQLGYSTESFDGGELVLSNAPSVVSALSGKSVGVQIQAANGVDGGTTRFTIRGNSNINKSNQPLIVIDGVPLENEPGLTSIKSGIDWGSQINNINSNDIENINILKGPTASALYGSRGSNGVVLITTKRGSKQKGIGVKYNVSHKVIQPYYYREVQNIFGAGGPISELKPTLQTNEEGVFIYPAETHATSGPLGRSTTESFGYYSTGVSWGPKMEGQQVLWWDGEMRTYDPQPDNLKLYFGNGHSTTHNISFSGGGEMGTMRVSLTRQDHDAIIPNSKYNQTTVNVGSRLDISSKLHADISLSYIKYHRKNSPSLGDDNNKSFGKGILYSWPRSYKGLEKEINILSNGTKNDYGGNYPFSFSPPDLWWKTFNNNTQLDRNKLIGVIALTYNITPWLNIMGRTGTDFTLNQFESRNKPYYTTGLVGGFYSNELRRDIVANNDILLTIHKEGIFNSQLNTQLAIGGTNWNRDLYGLRGQSGGNWAIPWLYTFNNFDSYDDNIITNEENSGNTTRQFKKTINSLYGFLNFDYKKYLFLELTGRNDWSSSLPPGSNSYFYPSVSLSFIPTEAFNLQQDWLSFWKIRSAYALTAVDTDPFQLDFTYNIDHFGGDLAASLPSVIPPISLKPQQSNSYEFGTTIGLINDKVNFDFTYYYIKSTDEILDAPLPYSSGAGKIRINSAVLENKGIEAILNIDLVNRRSFFWQTAINISRNRNYIVSLGEGAKNIELANIWGLNGPSIEVREGEEYGTIIGYDYVYHEETGQPILSEDGSLYKISDRRVPLGNASPRFTGGWTMRLGFKGLTLSTLVDTKWGGDIYAGSYIIGLQTGQSPETLPERMGEGLPFMDPDGNLRNVGVILPGVYEDGTLNDKIVHYYFKYIGNTGGWGRYITTPGIMENSWVKLREVAISYQFPDRINKKSKVFQDLTLSISGRDLFYIYTSLPDHVNPEGISGSGNAQGLEWAAYPGSRSITFGLNASF